MIWPQNFVRLRSRLVTRFSRQVWGPQKFILKLRRVQRKLHNVQLMLLTVQNAHNLHKRLQVQPFVPLVHLILLLAQFSTANRCLAVGTNYQDSGTNILILQ